MLKIEVFPELRGYCFPRYLNSVGCMLKSETHQNRLITINIVMEKMQLPRSLIKNVKIIENPKKKNSYESSKNGRSPRWVAGPLSNAAADWGRFRRPQRPQWNRRRRRALAAAPKRALGMRWHQEIDDMMILDDFGIFWMTGMIFWIICFGIFRWLLDHHPR